MKRTRTDIVLDLDRYLCGFFVFFCRLIKPLVTRFRPFQKESVKEIVVAKYVGLWSILLTQKLLLTLRENFPEAKITFLTFDMNERLLALMNHLVDHVLVVKTSSAGALIRSSFKAVSLLKKRRIDLYFDLEFFSRFSAIMCFFSQPRTAVGYESLVLSSRTSLYNYPAKLISYVHMSENFTNQARTLGLKVIESVDCPTIKLADLLVEQTRKKIGSFGLSSREFIIFNANTSEAARHLRRWSDEKWARLAEFTLKKKGAPIVFTGLSEDRGLVENIISSIRQQGSDSLVYNFAGKLDLHEFFALLSLSRLVVTVDSGAAHFAISLKKPTVILFGPEWPGLYGYQIPYCRMVYKAVFCSPCYNIHHGKKVICRNENRCMTTITPEEVFKEMEILSNHA